MATQYTAGIVPGQKWTAAIANQIGAVWETWTPVVRQGTTTFGVTVNTARYARIQKVVVATMAVTIASGTGQVGIPLNMSLPIPSNNPTWGTYGSAWILDVSTSTPYAAILNVTSSTEASFFGDWSTTGTWGGSPNIQMATSDQIRAYLVYEAA